MTVVATAPGKSILIGEHAAVYGRPALVAALDRRLTVRLDEDDAGIGDAAEVRLRLPQVGVDRVVAWDEIARYTAGARERWLTYRERPDPASFAALRGEDPAHVVLVTLGEAARELRLPPQALTLEITSEIPTGAGFGSSAAAGVATILALAEHAGRSLPSAALIELAQRVEELQHGKPSGVDATVVARGGLLWCERGPEGLEATAVDAAAHHLRRIRLLHTGTPGEATGAVVAAVAARLGAEPALASALGRMEAATRALRTEIGDPIDRPERVIDAIRRFERELEALGVVPGPVRRLVRRVERAGGAAKVSGAGSLAGPGAGSLLVYHPAATAAGDWGFLAVPADDEDLPLEVELLDVRLGGEGGRIEPS